MISGHSHSFDVGIAKTLGINAAIVFNHIVYWLRINAAKKHNIRDEKVWMYETQQEMAEFLDYMTPDQVKKAIVVLLDSGILIKGNYNANPFDKTSWYTTKDQSLYIIKKTLTKERHGTIDAAPRHDPHCPTAPSIYKKQQEHFQEEHQQEQQQVGSGSVSFSASEGLLVSPDPDEIDPQKLKAFNWFLKIGCDVFTATELIQKYSVEDIANASRYVEKQIQTNKKNDKKINNIVRYLKKTLEKKYWID